MLRLLCGDLNNVVPQPVLSMVMVTVGQAHAGRVVCWTGPCTARHCMHVGHVHVALVLASYSIIVSFILALVLNLHLFSLTSRVFLSFDSRHRDRDVYF